MNNSNKNNQKKNNQGIANPTKSTLGKIIIIILVAAMVLTPVVGLIFLLI